MCLNGTERKVKEMTDLDKITAMHQYLREQERKRAEQILNAYRQADDKNALERVVSVKKAMNKPADHTK